MLFCFAYFQLINGSMIDRPDLLRQPGDKPPTSRSLASLHEYADITDTARYNVSTFM